MRWPLDNFWVSTPYQPSHQGIDMAAPKGQPIFAPMTGTVKSVGTDTNYLGGLYVIIREDASEHYEHYMGHNSMNRVSVGQRVTEGQHIADVGATGTQVTGPHVHYQIRNSAGTLVDPTPIYNARKGGSMSTADLGFARIQAYHVAGRNGYDGRPNALAGECDADLNKNHVGVESNASVWNWYNSVEGQNYRNSVLPKVYAERESYKKQVAEVTADRNGLIVKYDAVVAENKALKEQLAQVPAADPDAVTVTKTSLWDWFKNLPFIKKG